MNKFLIEIKCDGDINVEGMKSLLKESNNLYVKKETRYGNY